MNVQRWNAVGLVIAISAISSLAEADNGRPDRQTLRQMGLGSMVVISDTEALSVRGHGYQPGTSSSVQVWGNSIAAIAGPGGGASSENGYLASGKYKAAGANYSEAGISITTTRGGGMGGGGYKNKPGGGGGGYGGGTTTTTVKYFAGGYSWGKAF